jgi:glycosyltransferase involved in cell wall biosynthesis
MSNQSVPRVAFRRVWRAVVPPGLRRYGQGAASALARRSVAAALADGEPKFSPGPVIVSGLLAGASGVSRAARLTVLGLQHAGYQPFEHDLAPVFARGDGAASRLPVAPAGGVWLLHVNAPEAIAAMSRISPDTWGGRYRVGYWAYELPVLPRSWAIAARFLHEIWVPSTFVAEAARAAGVKIPVRVMPHPVSLAATAQTGQREQDRFTVLAMGDLNSSWGRKNLLGSIEIFRAAFPEPQTSRRLIVKIQSTSANHLFEKAARNAMAGRSDISLVSKSISDRDIERLIAGSSVFLSPHRSEGFGLAIAEALLAGVPALATGWSGNVDFMRDVPELCIRYRLTPVRDSGGIYRVAGAVWAEPDIADAVQKLRALESSVQLRQKLAAQGRQSLATQLGAWSKEALAQTPFGSLARSL